jgi:hypothetical protein
LVKQEEVHQSATSVLRKESQRENFIQDRTEDQVEPQVVKISDDEGEVPEILGSLSSQGTQSTSRPQPFDMNSSSSGESLPSSSTNPTLQDTLSTKPPPKDSQSTSRPQPSDMNSGSSSELLTGNSTNLTLQDTLSTKPPPKTGSKAMIYSKITLLVHATGVPDMGYATVSLVDYTFEVTFFEFLSEELECLLGKNKEIQAVTATYPWRVQKHLLRKTRLEADFKTFFKHLKEAAEENIEIAENGCDINMLLHVGAREPDKGTS